MDHHPPTDQPDDFNELTPRMRRAMQEVADRSDLLEPGDHAAMRRAVDAHFARAHRSRVSWRVAGGAIAAVVAITAAGVFLFNRAPTPATPPAAPATRLAGDVDGNGHVDILDALHLARHLQSGRVDSDVDLTGDGVVDADDVDAVAALAVSLDGKGGQAG